MAILRKITNRCFRTLFLTAIGCLLISNSAIAHHAFAGVFDMNTMTEVEGEVTSVIWRNPHIRFSILDADGVSWDIESNSVSILSRMDIPSDIIGVGDSIRVAGYGAINGSNAMWVNNMLLDNGQEVVLRPGVARVWTGEKVGNENTWLAGGSEIEEGETESTSIFRVWSTHFTSDDRSLWADSYPLTEASKAALAKFDPYNSPIANCEPKGMIWLMEQPYPIEFVEADGKILFYLEEYDSVRTIYMNGQLPQSAEHSLLGHSNGYWEDGSLVVTTTQINYPYFNSIGLMQSEAINLLERFTPSANGRRLDYTVVIDDPAMFTEAVMLDKAWIWRPGEVVNPYKCARSE
ncbi:MAG: DUF6152 family protein [Arenicellaceae bacterium]|nr:DUF6152 family protein [Arenicellaceae bacterium]